MNTTQLKLATVLSLEEVADMLRKSAPAARTTIPEVGFLEERVIRLDEQTGQQLHLISATDANDPTVLYRFRFSESELESFGGATDTQRLAAALDHMDRCAKGVFN